MLHGGVIGNPLNINPAMYLARYEGVGPCSSFGGRGLHSQVLNRSFPNPSLSI